MANDYKSMTVAELKQLAKKKGIKLSRYATTKADIIDTIQKYDNRSQRNNTSTVQSVTDNKKEKKAVNELADRDKYSSIKTEDIDRDDKTLFFKEHEALKRLEEQKSAQLTLFMIVFFIVLLIIILILAEGSLFDKPTSKFTVWAEQARWEAEENRRMEEFISSHAS